MNDFCIRPHVRKGMGIKETLETGYNAREVTDVPPLIKLAGGLKDDELMVVLVELPDNHTHSNLKVLRIVTDYKLGFLLFTNKLLRTTWFVMPKKIVFAMNPEVAKALGEDEGELIEDE